MLDYNTKITFRQNAAHNWPGALFLGLGFGMGVGLVAIILKAIFGII